MGDVQINNISTRLEGFDDPLLGIISFEKFDDPLVGLERMQRAGEASGKAQTVDRYTLQLALDIDAAPRVLYRESNRILETFRESRPVRVQTRRTRDGYELLFSTDKTSGTDQ